MYNGSLGFIEGGKFLSQLNECQFPKYISAPCGYLFRYKAYVFDLFTKLF
jgi:hypothetical protein